MATRKSPRLNGPPPPPPNKQRKVDGQSNDAAVVEEATPPIFNLVDDCCYAMLDWLSLEDLRSFGQTCKWAQQLAADFYKMNHSAKEYAVTSSAHVSGFDVFDLENAQKILIRDELDQYRNVETYSNQTIKQIFLFDTVLTDDKVNCLKRILHTVERVVMVRCKISGDFYEKFLKFCTNVKVLCVRPNWWCDPNCDHVLIGTDNALSLIHI